MQSCSYSGCLLMWEGEISNSSMLMTNWPGQVKVGSLGNKMHSKPFMHDTEYEVCWL
jgi:hypothetical protein